MTEVPKVDIDSLPISDAPSPKRGTGSQTKKSMGQMNTFDKVDNRNKNPTSQTFGKAELKKSGGKDSELQRIQTV